MTLMISAGEQRTSLRPNVVPESRQATPKWYCIAQSSQLAKSTLISAERMPDEDVFGLIQSDLTDEAGAS